jgi:anti-anti-sigma factor
MAAQSDGLDRLFLVEFKDGWLTVLPLADVGSARFPEMEQSSRVIFEMLKREPSAKVLVDMGKLHICGSALLGLMVRVWKSVSPRSGVLAFCNINDDIATVFKQTRLDTLWAIYSSREAAYAA